MKSHPNRIYKPNNFKKYPRRSWAFANLAATGRFLPQNQATNQLKSPSAKHLYRTNPKIKKPVILNVDLQKQRVLAISNVPKLYKLFQVKRNK